MNYSKNEKIPSKKKQRQRQDSAYSQQTSIYPPNNMIYHSDSAETSNTEYQSMYYYPPSWEYSEPYPTYNNYRQQEEVYTPNINYNEPSNTDYFTTETPESSRQVMKRRHYDSPSPDKTPVPSPIIHKKKRKIHSNRHKQKGREKEDDSSVNELENELGFLRDDCATILINLESLRNAFLTGTTKKVVDKRRRSKTDHQEMEKEMRIAYDDLLLQVRQLEKKLEKLEGKSHELAQLSDDRTIKKRKTSK